MFCEEPFIYTRSIRCREAADVMLILIVVVVMIAVTVMITATVMIAVAVMIAIAPLAAVLILVIRIILALVILAAMALVIMIAAVFGLAASVAVRFILTVPAFPDAAVDLRHGHFLAVLRSDIGSIFGQFQKSTIFTQRKSVLVGFLQK